MVTAVMLLNWTDHGIKNVKESPKRLDGVKKLAKVMGGEVKSFYMTLGVKSMQKLGRLLDPRNDKQTKSIVYHRRGRLPVKFLG